MAIFQVSGIQAISDTLAHWQAWAQTFGGALTTFGWVAQTGHDEVNATGTGSSYAWTNTGSVLLAPTTALLPVQNYRVNGAWNGTVTSYTGANTANSATVCDLVTFASGGNTPVTYVCILSIAASGGNSNPSVDTTHWQPYIYEIWKSSGGQTASNPLYIRIVYTVASTGNTGPCIHFGVGSGIDANGNITGGASVTGTAPNANAFIDTALAGTANTGTMDFSGDGDNFRFLTWQGSVNAAVYQWMVVIDRAKTASGTDSDAFTYVGVMIPIATTVAVRAHIIPKVTLGAPTQLSVAGWAGTIQNGGITASMNQYGATPVFPIFPMLGFAANPLLGAVGFNNTDVTDGSIMPVWLYGASHNYLVNSKSGTTTTGVITGVANTVVPAIRWE